MQWVTIITNALEDEAARGEAEAAVANRGPVSQRRRRRGASPNASATSVTRHLALEQHEDRRAALVRADGLVLAIQRVVPGRLRGKPSTCDEGLNQHATGRHRCRLLLLRGRGGTRAARLGRP